MNWTHTDGQDNQEAIFYEIFLLKAHLKTHGDEPFKQNFKKDEMEMNVRYRVSALYTSGCYDDTDICTSKYNLR